MLKTLLIVALSSSISILVHIITCLIVRKPRFVVVGTMSYREFKSWHKAKDYIDNDIDRCQVFIYEKHEYTYITSSNYMGRMFAIGKENEVEISSTKDDYADDNSH